MSSTADRPPKVFSCVRCFERKVRCDKQTPCSNCVKAKVNCIFRIPPAPRRKKERPQEEVLLARLKICEDLLKSKGLGVDSPRGPSGPSALPTDTPANPLRSDPESSFEINHVELHLNPDLHANNSGQLLFDHGKSRFIENNLWTSVSNEFQAKEAITEQYSEDEDDIGSPVEESADFIFGYTTSSNSIQQLHPLPDQIFVLWQAFLENINPMTKLIHQPTFHDALVKASSNLENLPKGLEALMFSIYSAAVFSMDEDECLMKSGEPRKTLLVRYRHATRKALARARFMGTSDIQVLQAFMLYLLTMREDYDSRTTWTFAGVASRIAQGMGIHRDGTTLGVSPFDTEMRRRLWWQISILDIRLAELSGSGRMGDLSLSDSQAPSNIDDAEIYPDMKTAPISHTKPTEMIACLLRCEFGSFWKEKTMKTSKNAFENLRLASPWVSTLEERDAHINELEQRIEEKYLRYCDPSIPIQFLCIVIGRAAVNRMRFMAHHPRKYTNREEVTLAEREFLWNLAIKLLESDNLAHASKGIQRFVWHMNVYFHWQALIHVLNELRMRALGEKVDKAWKQVDEIFLHHPNFVSDNRKPLHVAVGSLCLKAYNAREAALREETNGFSQKVIPEYIKLLREQRESASAAIQSSLSNPESELNKANPSIEQMPATKWRGEPLSNPITHNSQQLTTSQEIRGQPPLPTLPPPQVSTQMQTVPSDQYMFASDPDLAQDLAMADMPMDWAQWDYIMQDSELGR